MKLYLSGPMTGYPDQNFPAFHATATALRANGYDVINPAELNPSDPPDDPAEFKHFYDACLRADLRAMMDCDAIALMDGWHNSNGANLELHVAHRVGMEVLFVADLVRRCPICSIRCDTASDAVKHCVTGIRPERGVYCRPCAVFETRTAKDFTE